MIWLLGNCPVRQHESKKLNGVVCRGGQHAGFSIQFNIGSGLHRKSWMNGNIVTRTCYFASMLLHIMFFPDQPICHAHCTRNCNLILWPLSLFVTDWALGAVSPSPCDLLAIIIIFSAWTSFASLASLFIGPLSSISSCFPKSAGS